MLFRSLGAQKCIGILETPLISWTLKVKVYRPCLPPGRDLASQCSFADLARAEEHDSRHLPQAFFDDGAETSRDHFYTGSLTSNVNIPVLKCQAAGSVRSILPVALAVIPPVDSSATPVASAPEVRLAADGVSRRQDRTVSPPNGATKQIVTLASLRSIYADTRPSGGPRPSRSGNASPRSVNDNDTELRQ